MPRMVMRSIYLPYELDDRARTAAYFLRHSKADLVRLFIERGLAELQAQGLYNMNNADLMDFSRKLFGTDPEAITAAEQASFRANVEFQDARKQALDAARDTVDSGEDTPQPRRVARRGG